MSPVFRTTDTWRAVKQVPREVDRRLSGTRELRLADLVGYAFAFEGRAAISPSFAAPRGH
jgi:hypothetical protein